MLRGGKMSAMTWVNKCGGTRYRAAFLMRLLGVNEMSAGRLFQAVYIQRRENVIAEGLSKWPRSQINTNLAALPPCVRWQEASLGETSGTACLNIVLSYCQKSELLQGLTQPIPRLGT